MIGAVCDEVVLWEGQVSVGFRVLRLFIQKAYQLFQQFAAWYVGLVLEQSYEVL